MKKLSALILTLVILFSLNGCLKKTTGLQLNEKITDSGIEFTLNNIRFTDVIDSDGITQNSPEGYFLVDMYYTIKNADVENFRIPRNLIKIVYNGQREFYASKVCYHEGASVNLAGAKREWSDKRCSVSSPGSVVEGHCCFELPIGIKEGKGTVLDVSVYLGGTEYVYSIICA